MRQVVHKKVAKERNFSSLGVFHCCCYCDKKTKEKQEEGVPQKVFDELYISTRSDVGLKSGIKKRMNYVNGITGITRQISASEFARG